MKFRSMRATNTSQKGGKPETEVGNGEIVERCAMVLIVRHGTVQCGVARCGIAWNT